MTNYSVYSKVGLIPLIVILILIIFYLVLSSSRSVNFITVLSVSLTLVLVSLTVVNVYTTHLQYSMSNTPVIDGDMIKDPANNYLDLKIINKGPGLATNIAWGLKVEGLRAENYFSNIVGFEPNDECLVFSNLLYALSRDDRSVLLKDHIPLFYTNTEEVKYILFLKYKKLMGKNNYYYEKIEFSSNGYKSTQKELIDCKKFETAFDEIKKWQKQVESSSKKTFTIPTG